MLYLLWLSERFPRVSHCLANRISAKNLNCSAILARAAFQKIPASYQNKSSSKRNNSCIGFIVLIPEQLLHSRKDLQKIRPITKWYSSTRLTNAYARIVKLFEIYYTNDFGFLPPLNLIGKLLLHNVQNSLKLPQ